MTYYHAINTGKGFITHEENESAHIAGHPGDIWITENSAWASRVGAVEKTKEEAQALVDASLEGTAYPDNHPDEELRGQQVTHILP
jgi:ABC-type nitrate/sulfonate/bicarbonate transport system substrate-binding protein